MAALPAKVSGNSVTVSWSGLDEKGHGSGIACYDVYVSKNNGAYSLWQTRTTAASAKYTGMIGHCYAFYCVATDNVGHREAKSPAAEAKVHFPVAHHHQRHRPFCLPVQFPAQRSPSLRW